jgi:membrane-associated phospholipid phosphatase
VDPHLKHRRSNDRVTWILIVTLILGAGAAEIYSPLAIVPSGLAKLAVACILLSSAAIFYRRIRLNENLAVSCLALVQALLFSATGSILSYLLARHSGPLWDSTLMGWDQALGFEWLVYVRFIDAHAWLALPFRLAYASLIPQIVLVILALGFSGRLDQLRAFILAAIGSGFVAILISPLFPAVSNYVQLGLTSADFDNVDPWAGYSHLHHLMALRNGTMAPLNLPEMQGIITFPSYHACLATLTLWGFWKSGLGWIRWPGSAVALATIASTPVDGGHYFVDVIAGIAIAIACIAAANRLVFLRAPFSALRASPFRRSRAAFAR